jgi:hypothetical protein
VKKPGEVDEYFRPNPNISRDGKFVAFSSDWRQGIGKQNVYILKMP